MGVWTVLLVAATALHLGFQLTVTALVYPALMRLGEAEFPRGHAVHSRAIVPVVAFVYGFVGIAVLGALLRTPSAGWVWVAAAASAAAVLVTAVRAAPLHARLGRQGPEPRLLASLVRADRLRTLAALLAAAAALTAALTLGNAP